MAERLHPGVYVEEVSSGIRPIEGVATSTAAFIGEAGRGIPDRPVLITSMGDYERAFGGHMRGPRGFMGLAVESFFRAGGRRAFAVRVLPGSATQGTQATASATRGSASWPALKFEARGKGEWSRNLRVHIGAATHFAEAEALAQAVVERAGEVGYDALVAELDTYLASYGTAGSEGK